MIETRDKHKHLLCLSLGITFLMLLREVLEDEFIRDFLMEVIGF